MSKSNDLAFGRKSLGLFNPEESEELRYTPAQMISVISAVRHRLQNLADKEGLTGPITEQVLQLDVVLQTLDEPRQRGDFLDFLNDIREQGSKEE